MGRFARPVFRRTDRFVAVRRIRLRGRVIEPGEPIEGFRPHVLHHWYRTLRIGVVDHPWTLQTLAKQSGAPRPFGIEDPLEPTDEVAPGADDATPEAPAAPEPVRDGRVWRIEGIDGEWATKREAQAFLDELGEE